MNIIDVISTNIMSLTLAQDAPACSLCRRYAPYERSREISTVKTNELDSSTTLHFAQNDSFKARLAPWTRHLERSRKVYYGQISLHCGRDDIIKGKTLALPFTSSLFPITYYLPYVPIPRGIYYSSNDCPNRLAVFLPRNRLSNCYSNRMHCSLYLLRYLVSLYLSNCDR